MTTIWIEYGKLILFVLTVSMIIELIIYYLYYLLSLFNIFIRKVVCIKLRSQSYLAQFLVLLDLNREHRLLRMFLSQNIHLCKYNLKAQLNVTSSMKPLLALLGRNKLLLWIWVEFLVPLILVVRKVSETQYHCAETDLRGGRYAKGIPNNCVPCITQRILLPRNWFECVNHEDFPFLQNKLKYNSLFNKPLFVFLSLFLLYSDVI